MKDREHRHRVVIIGGGFAGLCAARGLGRSDVEVILVDKRNFHLFQPLLYQVATGGLSPADIAAPIRNVVKKQENTRVLLGRANDFDSKRRRVLLDDGESLEYDTLVVAAGVTHHYFGNDSWADTAPGLKTVEDATGIRARVLLAFEQAERTDDLEERQAWLDFVIVGGGPTGVELGGAIGELARSTLRRNFRRFDPAAARVTLVEGADRVLPTFDPTLSAKARASLEDLGVEVRTSTMVSAVDPAGAELRCGEHLERIAARTVLWAAGVKASRLARRLAEATGAETDRAGRLRVEPDCSLAGHPEIRVVGDMAHLVAEDGRPVPGVAPAAMQQGWYVARSIRDRLRGRPTAPFRYRDKGSLAVIGRAAAVAQIGPLKMSGYPAWLLWLFVHIMYLVGFSNRLLVFIQWAHAYLTRGRGARLITGTTAEDRDR